MSKSCQLRIYDVAAIPTAANAKLVKMAAGKHKIVHGDSTKPSDAITTKNAPAYIDPRMSAQPISPSAMSPTPRGVDSTAS